MYIIKVDTDFIAELARECTVISKELIQIGEEVRSIAGKTSEYTGFGIESVTELLNRETSIAESNAEALIELQRKLERVIGIYESADNAVRRDIDNLPVLIHGNISQICKKADIISENNRNVAASDNITESALLYDNTVMHEDWLIRLIAKNRYGG